MKAMKDYSLDVTPLTTILVNSSTSCVKECLKHRGLSINFEPVGNSIFQCSILSTDHYRDKSSLIEKQGVTYFFIVVSLYILLGFKIYTNIS